MKNSLKNFGSYMKAKNPPTDAPKELKICKKKV